MTEFYHLTSETNFPQEQVMSRSDPNVVKGGPRQLYIWGEKHSDIFTQFTFFNQKPFNQKPFTTNSLNSLGKGILFLKDYEVFSYSFVNKAF